MVNKQAKALAEPGNHLGEEGMNAGLPGVADRAVRMLQGTSLGQQVGPPVAGTTVEARRSPASSSLDEYVCRNLVNTKCNTRKIAHISIDKPRYIYIYIYTYI
jgi:hypothetical protein